MLKLSNKTLIQGLLKQDDEGKTYYDNMFIKAFKQLKLQICLSVKEKWNLSKIDSKINEQFNKIGTQQQEMMNKYKGEDGNIKQEDIEKYNKEFNDLLNIEEIYDDVDKVKLFSNDNMDLSVDDITYLKDIIEIVE